MLDHSAFYQILCATICPDWSTECPCFTLKKKKKKIYIYIQNGWLGRAMVLGSFQCRSVLLLRHMIGQGPAVLAGRLFFILFYFILFIYFFFISSILSSFSNASSLWRRLDILKYCGFSAVIIQR